MRRMLAVFAILLATTGSARATGLLIPTEKKLPPLAMLNHQVNIVIEDQVAVTRIEQTFRNHTDRQLEATYIFPIPKGASVRKFSMWVNDKEVPGELVEAAKAKQIYQSIVQRTMDPGLLEYMGNNLLRLRVFPVPAKGDQKISISYTSIAPSDNDLVEYVYPLKTDGKAASTLEKFAINLTLKSQYPLQNIYSPSHAITMTRPNDRHAIIGFEKDQAVLDRDFQLFYTSGAKDIGITALTHRLNPDQNGYFMMLVSPRAELSKSQQVPRDMVFVLDTSGSMRGKRMTQARNALKYCLANLNPQDRFGLMNFATTVNKYTDQIQDASPNNVEAARRWVDALEATGGTAINDALAAALDMRSSEPGRTFTIVFFTDGQPTIGETNTDKILQNVAKRNTASTRIFTFGVGDDVNASMLDQLAESTRALSTYVRETEEIEARVSSLYAKISNPVLANLKLTVSDGVSLSETYPPQLPDLFHGNQVVVMGRFTGKGHAAIKLTGTVGMETKEFVYEVNFPERTVEDKSFVEDLWARRKVGYLLDQIRVNGEKKELVEEVVTLAKRYGITTPYTSYLLVPDGVAPIVAGGAGGKVRKDLPNVGFHLNPASKEAPPALQKAGGAPIPVTEFLKRAQSKAGDGASTRGAVNAAELERVPMGDAKGDKVLLALHQTRDRLHAYNEAQREMKAGNFDAVKGGKLGVDLSLDTSGLRNQCRLTQSAQRWLGTRNALEVGGVWIDEAYEAKMKTVTVKATSEAYFRILERHPSVRNVFSMGNHLVWVTPSGTALVIDTSTGAETMPDADIDALFTVAKK
jgi:Ca-activated chloride channel family protein